MLKAIFFDLGGTLVPENTRKTYPRVNETLNELRPNFILATICNTNASLETVRGIMKDAGILHFFDELIVSSEVGYSKPDEEIFRIALRKLGVKPNEAIMVGNRVSTDILGGNRMGMETVLINWESDYHEEVTCELEKPTYIIHTIKELRTIISELKNYRQ